MSDKEKKKERIQMTNIKNMTRNIITDPADMKKIIREYYKQLYI